MNQCRGGVIDLGQTSAAKPVGDKPRQTCHDDTAGRRFGKAGAYSGGQGEV